MSDLQPNYRDATPQLASTIAQLRSAVVAARSAGKTIGLVPTMGALHEGHLSLVRAARAECDFTIATIFVNPAQFGPGEDFDKYPRMLEKDVQLLGSVGTDLVFSPQPAEIYPDSFSTYVDPPAIAEPLEGQCRAGHFRGVTTIVLKLFNLAQADIAYFGQKDYQQARVIECMVDDLNVPVTVRVCPIIREADGLAMSSRNAYLNAEQRQRSLALWRSLSLARDLVREGERDASVVERQMRDLLNENGVSEVDYAVLADPATLQSVQEIREPTMALIAAYVGRTRLIDNLRLEP